ncbi:MAG: tail-specific protease [Deltaproteobacteria bacterium]|nr:MAG: tail-specific protease [Deltaproteobacteria bacterium]
MNIYRLTKKLLLLFLFCSLLAADCNGDGFKGQGQDDFNVKRNRLIGYILGRMLPDIHFSDKEIDDQLAEAVFDLYLKQLDTRKRFLLKEDVARLRKFTGEIDDNLRSGKIVLPQEGCLLLDRRIGQVRRMNDEIFQAGFDFDREEFYETDPEKYDYVSSLNELRERWRQILKSQVASRYLDLIEDREKEEKLANNPKRQSDQELYQEAITKVKKSNQTFLKRLEEESIQDHYDRFFVAVTRAFGPHTDYMAPASKEDFDIHMRGSLEGIGATLREEEGYIKVVSIVPGSASDKQGELEAGDIILEVAQGSDEPVDITDMRLDKAVRLIRGPKGSEVRLTIRKASGARKKISIIRDVVEIEESFVKNTMLTSKDGLKVGYILIPSFYRDFKGDGGGEGRNAAEDTEKAVKSLVRQGMEGLILDLRDNGGGSLVDAVDIAGLFIDSGPVVQVQSSNGRSRVLEDESRGLVFSGPMVVLVNQFSASASEIVAAALQDYHRAVIVGAAHTHGKGTVQTILDLNKSVPIFEFGGFEDLGALKVTIQKYYRVTGGSTQYKGVEPDIVLPSLFQHLESGEQYLDYSLPWDQGPSVKYSPAADRAADFEQLRRKSAKRTAEDAGFIAIREEARRAMEKRDQTLISLRLDDIKKRREEFKAAQEKLGEHYKKYKPSDDEEEGKKRDLEQERKKWLEEVADDPYIREAKNIIDDMNLSGLPIVR